MNRIILAGALAALIAAAPAHAGWMSWCPFPFGGPSPTWNPLCPPPPPLCPSMP